MKRGSAGDSKEGENGLDGSVFNDEMCLGGADMAVGADPKEFDDPYPLWLFAAAELSDVTSTRLLSRLLGARRTFNMVIFSPCVAFSSFPKDPCV